MNITSELRFIEVDNHEAVEIGDLEKTSEAITLARPKFNKEFSPECGHPRRGG